MNNSMQFTDDERARLHAVWKRPSEKKLEAIKKFIELTEFIVSDVLHHEIPIPVWSVKDAKKAHSEIEKHARALRLALQGLPPGELNRLGTLAGFTMQTWKMPEPTKGYVPVLSNCFMPITLRQLQIIESVIEVNDRHARKALPGPHKPLERLLIKRLILVFSPQIGEASLSKNGNFYLYIKELADIAGLEIGHDLFKSAFR